MKNLLIVCIISLSVITSSQAQEQWSLFSKVTADWCPNCGGWGWNMFKDGLEIVEGENVISWALHYSGGLRNQTAEEIADNLKATYQPRFYINNDHMSVNSNNVNAKLAELEETVELLNSFSPFAMVSTSAEYNGSSIIANTEIEFLESVDGNYYAATYLIKDHLIASQSNQGANADHRYVLLGTFNESTFGEMIASPSADAGLVYQSTNEYQIEIDDADLPDYYVTTILWNLTENDGIYRMFNGHMDQVQSLPSATTDLDLLESHKMSVQNNQLQVLTDSSDSYKLIVLTVDGKIILEKNYEGSSLTDLGNISNQLILVNMNTNGKQATQQFFIK